MTGWLRSPLPAPTAGVAWRRGTPGDLDVLTTVWAAADRVDEPDHPRTRDDIRRVLGVVDPFRAVLVGERNGHGVAVGMLFRPGDGPVRLQGTVLPEERGRGIGRALLAAQLAPRPRWNRTPPSAPSAPSMTGA